VIAAPVTGTDRRPRRLEVRRGPSQAGPVWPSSPSTTLLTRNMLSSRWWGICALAWTPRGRPARRSRRRPRNASRLLRRRRSRRPRLGRWRRAEPVSQERGVAGDIRGVPSGGELRAADRGGRQRRGCRRRMNLRWRATSACGPLRRLKTRFLELGLHRAAGTPFMLSRLVGPDWLPPWSCSASGSTERRRRAPPRLCCVEDGASRRGGCRLRRPGRSAPRALAVRAKQTLRQTALVGRQGRRGRHRLAAQLWSVRRAVLRRPAGCSTGADPARDPPTEALARLVTAHQVIQRPHDWAHGRALITTPAFVCPLPADTTGKPL